MKKSPWLFGGLLAIALSPLLFSMGVQAADTVYAGVKQANAGMPQGFIRVTRAGWNMVGDPPQVRFCLSATETKGLLANGYQCTRWGDAQDYLDARYPNKGVLLTRWDFQCSAKGNSASSWCEQEIVLYYTIAPRFKSN